MIKVIKLYADWCGPCRVMETMLQENDIKHDSIDITSPEGEELATKYSIRAIPALLIFDENNNLIRKKIGLPGDPKELINFIYETN